MKHEKRFAILSHHANNLPIDRGITKLNAQLPPPHEPVRLELNRDAGAILTMVTLGCFIMAAAVLLHLFVDLNTGGLVQ